MLTHAASPLAHAATTFTRAAPSFTFTVTMLTHATNTLTCSILSVRRSNIFLVNLIYYYLLKLFEYYYTLVLTFKKYSYPNVKMRFI